MFKTEEYQAYRYFIREDDVWHLHEMESTARRMADAISTQQREEFVMSFAAHDKDIVMAQAPTPIAVYKAPYVYGWGGDFLVIKKLFDREIPMICGSYRVCVQWVAKQDRGTYKIIEV